MARQVGHGEPIATRAPYVYRIGTPVLVGLLFARDTLQGFLVLNVAAGLLGLLLFWLWLARFGLAVATRILLVAVFAFSIHGPLRFSFFYPAYTDPWANLLAIGGLLLLWRHSRECDRRWLAPLAGLVFTGTLFREYVLLVGLAVPFACAARSGGRRLAVADLGPAAAGIAGLLLARALVEPRGGYAFRAGAWDSLSVLADDPRIWPLACCMALGPLGWLWIYRPRAAMRRVARHPELLAFLGGVLALSLVGGGDIERFLFWGAPVLLLLSGFALEELWAGLARAPVARYGFLLLVLVPQSLASRLFFLLPDWPDSSRRWNPRWPLAPREQAPFVLFTPFGGSEQYLDLFARHAEPLLRTRYVVQYAVLLALIGVTLWWGGSRWPRASPDRRSH